MKISPIYEGKIGIFRESVWFDLIGMIFETDMFYCMDGIFEIVIRKKQVLQGSIAPFSPEKASWGSCETQEYQENPDLGGSSIFRHSPHLGWSWVEDGWRLLTKILVHGKWVLHFQPRAEDVSTRDDDDRFLNFKIQGLTSKADHQTQGLFLHGSSKV